jgi:hypothetical protein
MHDDLVAAFEGKTASEIIEALGAHIYAPPLSALRSRLTELPAAMGVPMLVVDFDTEVHMQGIVGFLGNSTGRYLAETIEALRAIGASKTAGTLAEIRAILARPMIDPGNRAPDEYTLDRLWGAGGDAIRHKITTLAQQLYVYMPPHEREDIFGMLQRFLEDNKDGLLQVIRSCVEAAQK